MAGRGSPVQRRTLRKQTLLREAYPISTFTQVPPIAQLLTQPGLPMFIVVVCYNILQALSTNGERVLQELCKAAALPSAIASFIERVCDDPVAQDNVGSPKMFIEDSMKLFCSIVIKSCTSGRLQPSSSKSDPTFLHAQALRSTCLRLLKRFMPLPLTAPQPPIEINMPVCVPSALVLAFGLYCLYSSCVALSVDP